MHAHFFFCFKKMKLLTSLVVVAAAIQHISAAALLPGSYFIINLKTPTQALAVLTGRACRPRTRACRHECSDHVAVGPNLVPAALPGRYPHLQPQVPSIRRVCEQQCDGGHAAVVAWLVVERTKPGTYTIQSPTTKTSVLVLASGTNGTPGICTELCGDINTNK
jgi:hypothetical protein